MKHSTSSDARNSKHLASSVSCQNQSSPSLVTPLSSYYDRESSFLCYLTNTMTSLSIFYSVCCSFQNRCFLKWKSNAYQSIRTNFAFSSTAITIINWFRCVSVHIFLTSSVHRAKIINARVTSATRLTVCCIKHGCEFLCCQHEYSS